MIKLHKQDESDFTKHEIIDALKYEEGPLTQNNDPRFFNKVPSLQNISSIEINEDPVIASQRSQREQMHLLKSNRTPSAYMDTQVYD